MGPSCLHFSNGSMRAVVRLKICEAFSCKGGFCADTTYNSPGSIDKMQTYKWPSTFVYFRRKRPHLKCRIADTGSAQDGFSSKNQAKRFDAGTRLSRLAVLLWTGFVEKLRESRKKAPMKVFSLLVGYYSASALSTLVGQTGDWDVIMAAFAVASMEGISFLAYRLPAVWTKFEELVSMLNYWKVGLSLGFILDKFKLDSGLFNL